MKRRPRFKSFPGRQCIDCGGSGFQPAEGRTPLGKPMTGVKRCHCWVTVDLRKPKKEKKPFVYDGKAQAFAE